jgi:hypothetical protein
VSTAENTLREKKILRADQTDSQVAAIETSQFSCSGKEHEPSDKVPKTISSDDVTDFSDNSTLPHYQRLSLRKHQMTFHVHTTDPPPEERNDIWHIQLDSVAEELEISEDSRSGKERKLSAKLPSSSSDNGEEESSGDSSVPHLTRLCRQKDQFTSNASSNFPPKKRKNFGDIQTDIRDGEVETSRRSAARKKLKTNTQVPTTTRDRGLDFTNVSTSPRFKCLSFRKGNFLSHVSSWDISAKEKKTLKADQTDSLDGGSENSHFGVSEKELKPSEQVTERRSGGDGLEISKSSTSPNLKHFSLQKCQLKSRASNGHIPPKENKTSRYDQTVTQEEKLEISQMIQFYGASSDFVDDETQASGPVSPNEQQAVLSIDSHATKLSTTHSSQTDVANSSPERLIQKVCEDEHKVRDEDVSFFDSLIPHIRKLSPARKMLLRIKAQELIYNFIYNEEVQIQQ